MTWAFAQLTPLGTGTLTADKNVLPDPGRGAVACHTPLANAAVPQVCRPDFRLIMESGTANVTPLIVTSEPVKLTVAELPENLGLKAALNQITSPWGGVWLLKCVEKHTFGPQGV